MMLLENSVETLPAHVVAGEEASILGTILLPSITMSIWERHLDPAMDDAVCAALSSGLESLRFIANPCDVETILWGKLLETGLAPLASATMAADVAILARHFARIMEHEPLDIRLDRIVGNACRKFHADYVTARLITTYEGRATEWLDQESAARLTEGASLADLSIRSLRQGDVALLKGRLWADERAIVHRSPPIAGTGEERLLLVINPAEFVREGAP